MKYDEIGCWSEIKLDIIREYAAAYSRILTVQDHPPLRHVYIDGFSGSGFHVAKGTMDLIWGSPTSVLLVSPPFKEYHFIDLDKGNIEMLEEQVRSRTQGHYNADSVHFYNADCNKVLLSTVFPKVRYEDYVRALCLLDPYGLHLDWQVIKTAGRMKSVEIFLNFPIMDINRNVLRRDPTTADQKQVERLNRYWGDDSWKLVAYDTHENLFGFQEKTDNITIARAFQARLKEVAGFNYVPDPIPMRNSNYATLYYLFFASQKPVAAEIVRQIFDKYRYWKG
ncbi:MAG: three-Cys-motif partner protein TcmP [Ignavibacteriae bacterium]|nr:three-Cys-motif partner protein TcmP [Ignavibacteria bacterium]MBI3364122.1 three-Cys-motif partner protein TcmP [Ignavibacteriota bacterium]